MTHVEVLPMRNTGRPLLLGKGRSSGNRECFIMKQEFATEPRKFCGIQYVIFKTYMCVSVLMMSSDIFWPILAFDRSN